MLVQHILKEKAESCVVTVAPGWDLGAVAEILSSRRIGAVVISADGKEPLGIVSERDIVRELGRRGPGCMTDAVEAVMTRKLSCATPDEDAVSVLRRMTEGRFRHMPVLENGAMIGLISIGDVVKARLSELAMEKEALEGMIMGN